MKAWQLINKPSKWYSGGRASVGKYCLVSAILSAYGPDAGLVLTNLRNYLNVKMLSHWNDSHSWMEVFGLLKARDI
jgi:hypothetical protein